MKSGRNPENIRLERLNPDYFAKNISETKPSDDEERQYKALQDITSTLYRLGWASERNIEKIGNNLDKERMEILLGKEDRNRIRAAISDAKNLYVDYLKSAAYEDHLIFCIENTPYRVMEGKTRCATHITGIAENFESIDLYLREPEELEHINAEDDTGFKFVKELLDDDREMINLSKLLRKEILIDLEANPLGLGAPESDLKPGVSEIDLSVSFSLTLSTVLGSIQYFVTNFPDYLPTQLQFLNTTVIAGIDMPLFSIVKLGDLIEDGYAPVSTPRYPNGIFKLVDITDEVKANARFIGTPDGGILDTKQISAAKELRQAVQRNPTKFERLIGRIVETKSFKTFVVAASYMNVVLAFKELINVNEESTFKIARDTVNFIDSLATAWIATKDLSRLMKLKSGVITKEVSQSIGKNLTRLSAGPAFVSAAVSGYDSYMNFSEGDNDAAFAYGGAAFFGIGLGIALLSSNPIGWLIILLAVLSTGCGVLGAFFEDTPLEHFAKNYLLQDYGSWRIFRIRAKPPSTIVPWMSVSEHYNKRDDLIDDKFKEWENFIHAKAKLTEILYGMRIDSSIEYSKGEHHWTHDLYLTKTFTVTAKVGLFQKGYSELTHHELYLYPEGIKKGNPISISPRPVAALDESPDGEQDSFENSSTQISTYVINEDSSPVTMEINFDLDDQLAIISEKAEILFLIRYQLNPHITVPCTLDGVQRYIGYLEKGAKPEWSNIIKGAMAASNNGMAINPSNESMIYGPKQRSGTKSELMTPSFWGRA